MNTPQVPISWGELFDKITILQIKLENITSKNALENVELELRKLQSISTQNCPKTMETMQLEGELRQINQQLWDIEDKLRDKKRAKSFLCWVDSVEVLELRWRSLRFTVIGFSVW